VHEDLGSHLSAVEDITAALELLPRNPSLLYHRGMALFALGDNDSAKRVGREKCLVEV